MGEIGITLSIRPLIAVKFFYIFIVLGISFVCFLPNQLVIDRKDNYNQHSAEGNAERYLKKTVGGPIHDIVRVLID